MVAQTAKNGKDRLRKGNRLQRLLTSLSIKLLLVGWAKLTEKCPKTLLPLEMSRLPFSFLGKLHPRHVVINTLISFSVALYLTFIISVNKTIGRSTS